MKFSGIIILLIEKKIHFVAMVADRHYGVENGRVIEMIAKKDLAA